MVFVHALVGYIAVAAEIVLGTFMLIGKIYLDHWGPYSKRKSPVGAPALTVPAQMRFEMTKFLSGGGAPFPLMQAEAAHTAAHLLLDCQLEVNKKDDDDSQGENNNNNNEEKLRVSSDDGHCLNGSSGGGGGMNGAALEAAETGLVVEGDNKDSNKSTAGGGGVIGIMRHTASAKLQSLHLSDFAGMLETSLDDAQLEIYRRQTHAFASFKTKRLENANDDTTPATMNSSDNGAGAANLCFLPCKDGYVTAMW